MILPPEVPWEGCTRDEWIDRVIEFNIERKDAHELDDDPVAKLTLRIMLEHSTELEFPYAPIPGHLMEEDALFEEIQRRWTRQVLTPRGFG
jgi:hypothetical protein